MQKSKSIRDLMTPNPKTLQSGTSARQAAESMRDSDIGSLLVMKDGSLCGIVTDRDLVVRLLAEGKDPEQTSVGEICSADVSKLSPDNTIENAVELMRKKAIRRIPVLENGKPIGIVSLGDLAAEMDRQSVLGNVSAAEPNK
jgi:CBS domain-containing protein